MVLSICHTRGCHTTEDPIYKNRFNQKLYCTKCATDINIKYKHKGLEVLGSPTCLTLNGDTPEEHKLRQ